MDLLVTLDENYIYPLKVLLRSFFVNNADDDGTTIHLLHTSIPDERLDDLEGFCSSHGATLNPIQVDGELFKDAPVNKRYPQEMYYRLLAPYFLPKELERVLYLDPDILIINSLKPLWEIDLQGNAFAAASHTGITETANFVNRIRLETDHDYFNSGVILIDLVKARELVAADDVFQYVEKNKPILVLPDQDVFNALYGKHTLAIDDVVWNYDARNYMSYFLSSAGKHDLDWLLQNTAILHFCGKSKPWQPKYEGLFEVLYKHYMSLEAR